MKIIFASSYFNFKETIQARIMFHEILSIFHLFTISNVLYNMDLKLLGCFKLEIQFYGDEKLILCIRTHTTGTAAILCTSTFQQRILFHCFISLVYEYDVAAPLHTAAYDRKIVVYCDSVPIL